MRILCCTLALSLALLNGCRQSTDTEETKDGPTGALESVVDYGTGAGPIRAGLKAEAKLKQIQRDRQATLQDALETADQASEP